MWKLQGPPSEADLRSKLRPGLSPSRSETAARRFYSFFSPTPKLFSPPTGFIARPTHDRRAALRQACRAFPARGKIKEAGRPGPPPFSCLCSGDPEAQQQAHSISDQGPQARLPFSVGDNSRGNPVAPQILPKHRIVAGRAHQEQHRKRQPEPRSCRQKGPTHHIFRFRRHRRALLVRGASPRN
jgi:hypothetical protein